MFKPANIREFRTPATHQKPVIETIFGVDTKTFVNAPKPNLRGKFNQKNTNDITANGVVVVVENITYKTWYKADIEAGDQLIINGKTYAIKGEPDNCEENNRYMVLNLERISGGA